VERLAIVHHPTGTIKSVTNVWLLVSKSSLYFVGSAPGTVSSPRPMSSLQGAITESAPKRTHAENQYGHLECCKPLT
jgi:hypothetical protein